MDRLSHTSTRIFTNNIYLFIIFLLLALGIPSSISKSNNNNSNHLSYSQSNNNSNNSIYFNNINANSHSNSNVHITSRSSKVFPGRNLTLWIPYTSSGVDYQLVDVYSDQLVQSTGYYINQEEFFTNTSFIVTPNTWNELNKLCVDGFTMGLISVPSFLVLSSDFLPGSPYSYSSIPVIYVHSLAPFVFLTRQNHPRFPTLDSLMKAIVNNSLPQPIYPLNQTHTPSKPLFGFTADQVYLSDEYIGFTQFEQSLSFSAYSVNPVTVPNRFYYSFGEVISDLLEGNIDVALTDVVFITSSTSGLASQINVLGIASELRAPIYPNTQTFLEVGINFADGVYRGFMVSNQTTDDERFNLASLINSLDDNPSFGDTLTYQGIVLTKLTYPDTIPWMKTLAEDYLFLLEEISQSSGSTTSSTVVPRKDVFPVFVTIIIVIVVFIVLIVALFLIIRIMKKKNNENPQSADKNSNVMLVPMNLHPSTTSDRLSQMSEIPLSISAEEMEKILDDKTSDDLFSHRVVEMTRAPKGEVTFVFTDIQSSSLLWDWNPAAMRIALKIHNDLFTSTFDRFQGYCVRTEGDSYFVAFQRPFDAVNWALHLQSELVKQKWPPDLLLHKEGREVRGENKNILWRGLRVRIGMHHGSYYETQFSASSIHVDYLGPQVNRAARVNQVSHGGQICISGRVWDEIEGSLSRLGDPVYKELGTFYLRGLLEPERIIQILPKEFAERKFPPPKDCSTNPPTIEELSNSPKTNPPMLGTIKQGFVSSPLLTLPEKTAPSSPREFKANEKRGSREKEKEGDNKLQKSQSVPSLSYTLSYPKPNSNINNSPDFLPHSTSISNQPSSPSQSPNKDHSPIKGVQKVLLST